jgi:hypothetical protein
MKKSIIIAALGLAVEAVSSFGQGAIQFETYLGGSDSGGVPTFFAGTLGSGPVGAGYSADLLWSLTPITDAAGFGALTPGWNFSGSGSPSVNNVATPFLTGPGSAGYFNSGFYFVLNPYTSGTPVYFEVIAYQTGLTYATSQNRGHSASFNTTLGANISLPSDSIDNYLSPFTVNAVPEPTTLALAGLGGLASLVAFRRKQS